MSAAAAPGPPPGHGVRTAGRAIFWGGLALVLVCTGVVILLVSQAPDTPTPGMVIGIGVPTAIGTLSVFASIVGLILWLVGRSMLRKHGAL